MFLLTSANTVDPNVAALVGYIVMALILILAVIIVVAIVKRISAKLKKTPTAPAAEPATASDGASQPTAPGSAGQLKLHDVDPKTAAMLMAIVADKTDKPLNELRFISIKEIK